MNATNNWTPLSGGNVNSVAFKDNVVRRKLTAESPAIHQLLQHLEAKNLQCVPRFLDRDENYEYLSYFAFEFIPFHPQLDETIGKVSIRYLWRRLEVFCEAYGQVKPNEVLEYIPVYLTHMNADLRK